jgi:plasmid stabilization system protein ParE
MKIRILTTAKQDLIEGFHFYEKQTEGIGSYFIDSLYSDIDSLVITSGIHSIYFKKYYRLLSKRFPFAIYYRIEDNIILIDAVLDCRKDPAWIRDRFK